MSSNTLEHALPGQRRELESDAGVISYYTDAPAETDNCTPLLLIHTINAAAGAHEVRPVYEHYRQLRPVYALDLPGYGFSERSDRDYTARLMTNAIHHMVKEIQRIHGSGKVDAMAVSTSCEFLARAAHEAMTTFNSLALVAPTGFSRMYPYKGEPLSSRGMPGVLKFLKLPIVGEALFK